MWCPGRAQRLFHADFPRPLRYRHQHDVHQSHAADPQRDRPDERQQNLQPHADDVELRQLFLGIEDEDRALIVRLETVRRGQRVADRFGQLLVFQSLEIQPDPPDVVDVLQTRPSSCTGYIPGDYCRCLLPASVDERRRPPGNVTPFNRIVSPNAFIPENSLSFASDPMTAT